MKPPTKRPNSPIGRSSARSPPASSAHVSTRVPHHRRRRCHARDARASARRRVPRLFTTPRTISGAQRDARGHLLRLQHDVGGHVDDVLDGRVVLQRRDRLGEAEQDRADRRRAAERLQRSGTPRCPRRASWNTSVFADLRQPRERRSTGWRRSGSSAISGCISPSISRSGRRSRTISSACWISRDARGAAPSRSSSTRSSRRAA